eukprot:189049_1
MAAIQFRRNMMLEQINGATSVIDLIPMLDLIELSTIQDILRQKLQQTETSDIPNLFCTPLSIEKILPIDIIGYITSFYNMSRIQSVSQSFNKCYQQNKKREIHQREMVIADTIQSKDGHSRTLIVDPTRTELNENEMRLKYVGPLRDLPLAL